MIKYNYNIIFKYKGVGNLSDNNKKVKSFLSDYGIAIIIMLIPTIFAIWFIVALLDTPNKDYHSRYPSIKDEKFLKDYYGGTKYYSR